MQRSRTRLTRSQRLAALIALALLAGPGCNSVYDARTSGGGAAGGGGGSGASSTGNGGSGGGGGGTGGGDCLADVVSLDVALVNMVILVDQSGSMNQAVFPGPGVWFDLETAGVGNFVSDVQSAGLDVALNYFPAHVPDPCLLSHYDPPQLPLTDLATSAAVVIADLTSQPGPVNGDKGTSAPALEGSLAFAVAHKTQHPNQEIVVVLMTDAGPMECETSNDAMAAFAADALSSAGVRTYGIALDGHPNFIAALTLVATAGGGQVYDNSSDFLQVQTSLELIHEHAFPCAYPVAAPPSGGVEPDQVNVTYAPGGNGTAQTIAKVPSIGYCDNGGGWTFDQEPEPTEIIFCEATCDALRADPAPQVEVLFGCPTAQSE